MNAEQIAKLKELSQAATPGPWGTDDPWIVYAKIGSEVVYLAKTSELDTTRTQYPKDAAFIAAANPAAVQELIGDLEIARAAIEAQAEQGELPPLPVDLDYLIEYIAQPAVREALRNQISAYARAAIAARQQPQDERAAFEAWAVSEEGGWMPGALNRQQYGNDYTDDDVQAEWRSWQARAAMAKGGPANCQDNEGEKA